MSDSSKCWHKVNCIIDDFDTHNTYRLRVNGGYLYLHQTKSTVSEEAMGLAIAMVFVPHPPQEKGSHRK